MQQPRQKELEQFLDQFLQRLNLSEENAEFDSLALMQLIVEIELNFEIEFHPQDILNMTSLQGVRDSIMQKARE